MNKHFLLFSFFIFHFSLSYAQEKRMCEAETLVNKPDVIIQKDYLNIGRVTGITVSVETITDLNNKIKLMALDQEYSYSENSKTINRAILLDPDETDALLIFLQNITDNVIKMPAPSADKEFSFISKSGFECGCYWNNGWSVYVKIEPHNSRANVEFTRDDFMAYQSFVKQARAKMQ